MKAFTSQKEVKSLTPKRMKPKEVANGREDDYGQTG
jgi:hypothetical protein